MKSFSSEVCGLSKVQVPAFKMAEFHTRVNGLCVFNHRRKVNPHEIEELWGTDIYICTVELIIAQYCEFIFQPFIVNTENVQKTYGACIDSQSHYVMSGLAYFPLASAAH